MKRTISTALVALAAGLFIGHGVTVYGMPWQEESTTSGATFQPLGSEEPAWCLGVEVRGSLGIFTDCS
jgi:hypothetical protein